METQKEKLARIEHEDKLRGKPGTFATMKVKADNEQGFMVINEHDFDSNVHEKFEEAKAAAGATGSGTSSKAKKKD